MSQVSISDSGGPGDCRSEVFIVEEVDAVGERRLGDIKTVNVGTLLEDFFEGISDFGLLFFNCQILRIFRVSASRLKELYCDQTSKNVNLKTFLVSIKF
jgi:hypothetical protein